jgi:hypothetical protein
MHPYILMELARIRTDALIDEARRTERATRSRRRRAASRGWATVTTAANCAGCGRSPCICTMS